MLPRPAAITLTLLASCQWVREAIGAMQNSLTGWHPANRIRGCLPQAIQEGRRYDELATLAWKGRFGGTGNFPANGSNQLPSWKNKVRLRGSWRTPGPWPLLRPTRGILPLPLHPACQPPVFMWAAGRARPVIGLAGLACAPLSSDRCSFGRRRTSLQQPRARAFGPGSRMSLSRRKGFAAEGVAGEVTTARFTAAESDRPSSPGPSLPWFRRTSSSLQV